MVTFGKLVKHFQGKTTLFGVAFFISGHIMHWYGKLNTTYIGYMVALMSAVIGKSIKDDYFAKPDPDTTTTTVATPGAIATQTKISTPAVG
jgi:hypothetical protein